jgi:hypothetical protein
MSKAVGWTLIIALVLIIGTHPGVFAGLVHHCFGILQRAGDELSSFVSKL